MKTLFTLTFLLFASFAQADFFSAQKDYQDGRFKKAYNEYLVLAKLGNSKAQFNLAVMLAKGQGVETNLIEAYAWSKTSESFDKSKNLLNLLTKDLSEIQLKQALVLADKYQGLYAYELSKTKLGPIPLSENESNDYQPKIINNKIAPRYPRDLALNKKQGWANISYNIYPDGSVRDISVIDGAPSGAFTNTAIETTALYRYKVSNKSELYINNIPVPSSNKIEFKLAEHQKEFYSIQLRHLDKLKEQADQGDKKSQFLHAQMYEELSKDQVIIDPNQKNFWLFKSAQNGIIGAQAQLGRNIFYGISCKQEKQKGFNWVMLAAENGYADAQFLAYQILKTNSITNPTNQNALYWLTQAAENNSTIAQLHLAKEIALSDTTTQAQLKTATTYLSNYYKKVHKTIQWYQINALVLNKQNKNSKAIKNIKKAISLAKKAKWDLTELELLKKSIVQNKT